MRKTLSMLQVVRHGLLSLLPKWIHLIVQRITDIECVHLYRWSSPGSQNVHYSLHPAPSTRSNQYPTPSWPKKGCKLHRVALSISAKAVITWFVSNLTVFPIFFVMSLFLLIAAYCSFHGSKLVGRSLFKCRRCSMRPFLRRETWGAPSRVQTQLFLAPAPVCWIVLGEAQAAQVRKNWLLQDMTQMLPLPANPMLFKEVNQTPEQVQVIEFLPVHGRQLWAWHMHVGRREWEQSKHRGHCNQITRSISSS